MMNFVEQLIKSLFGSRAETIKVLKKEWDDQKKEYTELSNNYTRDSKLLKISERELDDANKELSYYKTSYKELKEVSDQAKAEDEVKTHWDNKRPYAKVRYAARPAWGSTENVEVDPRIFFTPYGLPKVGGLSHDEKAMNALKYVIKNIHYLSDMTQFKAFEEWLFAFETLKLKKGDCEDGAILLANIMIISGIPSWRIRLNAGDVKGGGHAYVTYLPEGQGNQIKKPEDMNWFVLDWCYWKEKSLNWKQPWKSAKNYFGIWFSWNTQYTFKGSKLGR